MVRLPTAVVLGAPDPEMERIEELIRGLGIPVHYAACGGTRVHPGVAYEADATLPPLKEEGEIWAVECDGPVFSGRPVVRIDHHRPGDPGYGKPPAEYLAASSVGQVLARLGLKPRPEDQMVAAADHCLAAAYEGACPGVDPDALIAWRVASRAVFRERQPDTLASAKVTPEEANLLAVLEDKDGQKKALCQTGTPEYVRLFLDWAETQGVGQEFHQLLAEVAMWRHAKNHNSPENP